MANMTSFAPCRPGDWYLDVWGDSDEDRKFYEIIGFGTTENGVVVPLCDFWEFEFDSEDVEDPDDIPWPCCSLTTHFATDVNWHGYSTNIVSRKAMKQTLKSMKQNRFRWRSIEEHRKMLGLPKWLNDKGNSDHQPDPPLDLPAPPE